MRTLVRFYNSNIEPHDHPDPVPSAVMHHVDCPQSAYHVELEEGEQEHRDDGWWECFHTENEAREAAEAHDQGRVDRPTRVTYSPQCCRHLGA